MRNDGRTSYWLLGGLLILAWALLTGCERPDPQEAVILSPTAPPTAPASATAGPTQAPVQVYVVVVQPTAPPSASSPTQLQIAAPSATLAPVLPTATPPGTSIPTAIPEGFYSGWAWTESLAVSGEQAAVDQYGLLLRDRPSRDGREVGIVVGFADLVVVGQARCGYTPVLVNEHSMLSRTSPRPEVATSMPLPTPAPPFAPTPFPERSSVMSGWAHTDALTILGQTAIGGPLGVNLRSDPCLGATNLGFIPAGANMIVTGWPNGDYTPVRINKDLVQPPLEPLTQPPLLADGDLLGGAMPGAEVALSPVSPTIVVTSTATLAPTATLTPIATLTPTTTVTATVNLTPSPTITP
jgi:hypothetical protein